MDNCEKHVGRVESFETERAAYNEVLAKYANLEQKKFFGLDQGSYADKGYLDKKTKELQGFVSSLVLRCDDCILYHLMGCAKAGVTSEELAEAVQIGMLVGGSITIPHVRRAMKVWDEELLAVSQEQQINSEKAA